MGMELGGGGWHDGKLSASTPFHLVPGTEMLEGGTLFVEKESQDPGSTRVLVSWATLLQMARFPNRQQAFPQEIPWSWS